MSAIDCRSLLRLPIAFAAIALSTQHAAAPAAAAAESEEFVILTYDVGDLLLDVPDYPYPGSGSGNTLLRNSMGGASAISDPSGAGMGGMGGGFFAVPDQPGADFSGGLGGGGGFGGDTPGAGGFGGAGIPSSPSRSGKITIDDLIEVLTSVVAPETWPEFGGEGEVQYLGTSLIIRQTPDVHDQIKNLLEQIRQSSGKQKTVAIDARWLLLTSDELESLMPPNETENPKIDRKVLGEFTRRPSSIRGQTNCFTGQLVYLVSGTRRNVVTSFVPVVGSLERPQDSQYAALPGGARVLNAQTFQSSRAVGYQPVISTPNLGVLLQIRPTLIPDSGQAIVDLHSTLTVLGESAPELTNSSASDQDHLVPKVDRVAIETQEIATTLSVPLGEPVLAGGLTYVGPSAGALRGGVGGEKESSAGEAPQLYLILELK